jgi:hypothetical protein
MASNRDNRVGLANLLAQGISTGSESYRSQREKAKKDVQTAMLAQMAFNKMKQDDINKQIDLASQMASSERGENISKWQLIESAKQAQYRKAAEAVTDAEKVNAQIELQKLNALSELLRSEMTRQGRLEELGISGQNARAVALIQAGARGQAGTAKQAREEKVNELAYDAVMYARDWINSNNRQGKEDPMDLALSNLDNPKFFPGATKDQRVRAKEQIHKYKQAALKEQKAQADLIKSQGIMGLGMGQPGSMGPTDYYSQAAGDAVSLGARPVN